MYFKALTVSLLFELHAYCLAFKGKIITSKSSVKWNEVYHARNNQHTATLFFLILPILGSWNQTVELSFQFSLNFSRLKSQMTDELKFHK